MQSKFVLLYRILAFPGVCEIDFIVIAGIFFARSTTFPSLNREYRYSEDRYTGVLPHTIYKRLLIVLPGISLNRRSLNRVLLHTFTITFAGQTNVDRYTGNIVKPKIVKPGSAPYILL